MKNRRLVFICILLFILLIIVSCSNVKKSSYNSCLDKGKCIILEKDDPIKIGVMAYTNGEIIGSVGRTQLNVVNLALDEYKNFLNRNISVIFENSMCSVEGGANSALKFASDPDIVGIIGPTCSDSTVGAGKIISNAGLVMISGSNNGISLTAVAGEKGKNWNNGYFRTTYNGAILGDVAAILADKLNLSKLSVIDSGDEFTSGLANHFVKKNKELGINNLQKLTVDMGDTNMKPLVEAIKAHKPEGIFIPAFPNEVINIINETKKHPELSDIKIILTDSSIHAPLINSLKEKTEGIYFISDSTPKGDSIDQFSKRYREKYNDTSDKSSFSGTYSAVQILLSAVASSSDLDLENNRLIIHKDQIRDKIYSYDNFHTITGSIDCDEFGDCGKYNFNILLLESYSEGIEGLRSNIVDSIIP